jgi:hypothetical protein
MGRLRLLAVSAAALAVTCGACIHGRDIELPPVQGVLIDKQSQQPVAGAELFRSWTGGQPTLPHGSPWIPSTPDWVTTDAEGRFSFPEVTARENLPWWAWSKDVWFIAVDDRYGAAIAHPAKGSEALTLEIERDGREIAHGRSLDPGSTCGFNTRREGFWRCCTLLYPENKCEEWKE